MKNSSNHISELRPHDSAYKHVSGAAEYTDDIKAVSYTHLTLPTKA